jgi:hypothetical protein
VVVGCDVFGKKAQSRVAVALGKISEKLIISAVFLDDVDAILDGAGPARNGGHGTVRRHPGGFLAGAGRALVTLGGISCKFLLPVPAPRQVDDAERAGKQLGDVLGGGILLLARLRSFGIGQSGVTRTEVGYQPTGIKPSAREWPMLLTSNTATLLLQALATNSFRPSGDSARLLGVEPGRAAGESEASSVSAA